MKLQLYLLLAVAMGVAVVIPLSAQPRPYRSPQSPVNHQELNVIADIARAAQHNASDKNITLKASNEINKPGGVKEIAVGARAIAIDASKSAKNANTVAKNAATVAKNAANTAQAATGSATTATQNDATTHALLDRFWVLIAALLVFFMQAGFKCLEVGTARQQHSATVGIMNLMNWLVVCVFYYLIGYGLMFGYSDSDQFNHHGSMHGLIGNLLGTPPSHSLLFGRLGMEYFLFQLAFAATTATIVDGAISERTNLLSYFFVLIGITTFIYPVFGHWAWNNLGWLKFGWQHQPVGQENIQFHDFAGSTVVHSVGAWISLVAVYCVGNRFNRFNVSTDQPQPDPPKYSWRGLAKLARLGLTLIAIGSSLGLLYRLPKGEILKATEGRERFQPFNIGYAVLGVIMLWFGWWGFNGGSVLQYNNDIANIILHTNLAGASAGIVAYLHAIVNKDTDNLYSKVIGGVLGGLVAITASCDVVSPMLALFIGSIAGIIHNKAYDLLLIRKVDDVAGAIPVHGACGVWGTLMAGVGVAYNSWVHSGHWIVWQRVGWQMAAQVCGILTAFLFTSIAALILFSFIDVTLGLRPPATEEQSGTATGALQTP